MPPLKTYIYQHKEIGSIKIEIKAYEQISAKWKLQETVKNINDFKLV